MRASFPRRTRRGPPCRWRRYPPGRGSRSRPWPSATARRAAEQRARGMDDLTLGPRVAQFVAGDTAGHLDKTLDAQAPCDMWIVNWEAAITDKARARATTRTFLERSAGDMRGERVVRVNPLRTGEGAADLDEIGSWPTGWIDGILLPLVESPADVAAAAAALDVAVAPRLHVLVETPRAVLDASAIAAALAATGRAGGLFAGLADFTAAMGVWET